MSESLRVFVTGAFGNIGRHAVSALISEGHRVKALAFESDARARFHSFGSNVEVIRGDVRDAEAMARAVQDVDCVVHLAYVIPPVAHERPDWAESVNVDGTKTLLEACAAQSRPPKFLFASTLDVYGKTLDQPPPRRITDPLHVTDNYSAHKIACESLVQKSGLTWSIFRFADVPPIEVRSPHPIMFEIPLTTRIEVIHPIDAGLAVARGISRDALWGTIWNIGGGSRCQLTYGDYLGAFLDAMGVGRLPEAAFSTEPYCTDWLDTDASEALLHYQHRTFQDVVNETAALLGWRRPLARAFRPFVRAGMLRLSKYWRKRHHRGA